MQYEDTIEIRGVTVIGLRGGRLVLLGILVAPLVMAGYVGLAVLLFLPLLGLRRIFRRRSTPAVVRWRRRRRTQSLVVNHGSVAVLAM